LLKHKLKSYN